MSTFNQRSSITENKWNLYGAAEPVQLRLMTDPEDDETTEDAEFEELDENYFGDTSGDCQ